MPRAGEIMSMRGMGMPRTPGQGAVRRAMMQRAITPMVGGKRTPRSGKPVQVAPLAKRMSAAYERLESAKNEESDKLSPKTAVALGKLVLEFEQVNASLGQLRQQIGQQSRVQKQIGAEEKKLLKKEEDSLVSVRGSFLDIRAKLGLFAGALAIKSALEGRPGDAAVNAGAAVTAFLPEIINIVTGAVMGKMLLGGGKPGGAPRMPRGGGKLGMGLGLLALLGMGGMAMNQSGTNAEQRRADLIRQQKGNTITPEDTKRFGSLSARFDKILAGMVGLQDQTKSNMKTPKGEDTPPDDGGDGDGPRKLPPSSFVPQGFKGTNPERAMLQTIGELEGADYNTVYGGEKVPELTQMTLGELYSAIKLGGDNAIPERLGGGTIPFVEDKYNSSASGFLQLMPRTLKGLLDRGDFKETDVFTPELQNRMAITLARQGGINPNDGLDMGELRKLNNLWASFGPKYGQTGRTLQQSSDIFKENLERIRNESKGEEVSVLPVPISSSKAQQPIASAAGPASSTPNIDPNFDDVTRAIQALSYLTEWAGS